MVKKLIPTWSDCVIGIVVIILFCVTLLLNILALHYTYNKIRKPSNKKIPHLLVGALSLSGLGIAVFEYPPFIASRFHGDWLYDSGVCNFVAFVIVLFGNLTICMVVLMSLERLGAIVFPFFYKEYVNFRKAVLILLFLVGYSIFLASIPLFLDRIRLNVATGVCTYSVDSHNTNTKIVVAVMVAHYIGSILIMFVSNMVVVRTVSLLDRNTMSGEYENRCRERKQHNTHACLNFAKMVGVLAFCYTICWTAILLRILLLYVYGWRNYYYDQVVIVLTTFDPLINHCVCLWIMRKYRDGYASSMGSLMSCFKISDDGIWATTLTRLSTISRRSTYSRASTRSSSRNSSKPYFYKQVPQNADNPQQDQSPEGEEIPDQLFRNNDQDADKLSDKRVVSDGKREWSEILRELNAEKERFDKESSSPENINVLEKGDLHGDDTTRRQSPLERWRAAFQKLKTMRTDTERGDEAPSSTTPRHDVLTTLQEIREDINSEHPSTASEAHLETSKQAPRKLPEKTAYIDEAQAQEPSTKLGHELHEKDQNEHVSQEKHKKKFLSDDVEAKEQWDKILRKLSEDAKQEGNKSTSSCLDQRPSSDISQEAKKSNLPELLQELRMAKSEEQPELLRYGSTAKNAQTKDTKTDLPEIVQDTTAKDDGIPTTTKVVGTPTTSTKADGKSQTVSAKDDGKSSSSKGSEQSASQTEDDRTESREARDSESRDQQSSQSDSLQDEDSQKHSKSDED